MEPLLNIASVDLVSTIRTAPQKGAPSSQDYNDSQRECLQDLASLADTLNTVILPILNQLRQLDSAGGTLVLNGDTLRASSDPDLPLFNSDNGPLSVAEVFDFLSKLIKKQQTSVDTLAARVSSISTQLSSSNQNDIAKAIQGFSDQLNQLYLQLQGAQNASTNQGNNIVLLQQEVTALQTDVANIQANGVTISGGGGGGGTDYSVPIATLQSQVATLQTSTTNLQNLVSNVSTNAVWSKFLIGVSGSNFTVNGVSIGAKSSSNTQQIALLSTMPREAFHAVVIKVNTALTGVTAGTCTVSLGTPTVPDSLMLYPGDLYDVTKAVSDTEFYSTGGTRVLSWSSVQVVLQIQVPPTAVSNITGGVIEVSLLTSVVGADPTRSTTGTAVPIRKVTANTLMNSTDYMLLVDASGGARVINPPAAPQNSQIVKKIDSSANTVTITPLSGLIDGAANKVLSSQNAFVEIVWDGTDYWIG